MAARASLSGLSGLELADLSVFALSEFHIYMDWLSCFCLFLKEG